MIEDGAAATPVAPWEGTEGGGDSGQGSGGKEKRGGPANKGEEEDVEEGEERR